MLELLGLTVIIVLIEPENYRLFLDFYSDPQLFFQKNERL